MKRGPEYSDSARKKLVGEYLRNADKFLKNGEYEQALAEVERSLELEPGNFYAQAYKERITALRDKHARPGDRPAPQAAGQPAPPKSGLGSERPSQAPPPDLTELTEATGALVEEVAHEDVTDEVETPAGEQSADMSPASGIPAEDTPLPEQKDLAELKERIGRERSSQETETSRQAEEFTRKALEEELREHEATERLKAGEQHAMTDALAGAAAAAVSEVVNRGEGSFTRLLATGDLEGAFRELASIGIADPGTARLGELTAALDAATRAALKPAAAEQRTAPREIHLQWYGKLLRSAWSEGAPNRVQADAVANAKKRFKVTPEEEKGLLAAIQKEIVAGAVKEAYGAGEPDPETKAFLEALARELSAGDIEAIRASVRS
jgi:hypothetical protein